MMVRTWRGKRFEDMTHEELVKALAWAVDRLVETGAPEFSHLRAEAKIDLAAREIQAEKPEREKFTGGPARGDDEVVISDHLRHLMGD